jgi:glycosyltransferase involved in cell wall biosynthesis
MADTSQRRRFVFSNYDSPSNPFYAGGGALAIHEVARRLATRHTVRVVTGAYPDCRDHERDGVAYEHLGRVNSGGKTGQLWFQFRLPGRARRGDFDLWCESLTPPFSTACLQRQTDRPVVALTQVLAGQGMQRTYKLPFAAFERAGLRTYRHAIALSGHLRDTLAAINPALRVAVIPNGVARELIDLQPEREERHILFLGRFDKGQKGLDLLLDAYAGMVTDAPVPLVIAGAGPARTEAWMRKWIRFLDIDRHVTLPGRVTGAGKHDLLRRAYFLAMPSRYEASPIALLEAFCYGVPAVMCDIPDLRDVPATCAVKTRPEWVVDLSREMLRLIRDTPRRRAMGAAAKEHARRFDWDDLARQYEDFFEDSLRNR